MTAAIMQCDQARPGSPSLGSPGIARNDLWENRTCTFTSTNVAGSYQWSILDKPPGSLASFDTPNAQTAHLTPDVGGVDGTYRVMLSLDGGGPTSQVGTYQILVFRVRYDVNGVQVDRGWAMPAVGEQLNEGNYGGNQRGYDETFRFMMKDILAFVVSGGSATAGGDLSGVVSNATVQKIQNRVVSASPPNDGDLLTWVNADAKWEPKPVTLPNLGGDTTGPPTANTTMKIRGASVASAAGALVLGAVLRVVGGSALDYGPVDLSNANAVANQLPGASVNPNFGAQAISGASLATTGDVTVGGNLTVNGTTVTVNSTTLDVDARVVHANSHAIATVPVPTQITGFEVERGDNGTTKRDAAAILWDETNQLWQFAFQTATNDTAVGALLPIKAWSATLTSLGGGGAGYATIDNAGKLGFASTVATSGLAPGTAGQVMIATPTGAWTSLINVDLTTGVFNVAGTGTNTNATIGPLTGLETTHAALWLLAHGTARAQTNRAMNSDGVSVTLNAPGGGTIYLFDATTGVARVQVNSASIVSALPWTFTDLSSVTRASLETTHGKGTFGGGGTEYKAVIGPLVGFETTNAAIYLLPAATAAGANNWSMFADGTNLALSAVSVAGSINFYEGGTSLMGTLNSAALKLYVPEILWHVGVATPTITQVTPTADVATTDLVFQAQAPFATATINRHPGNTVVKIPTPLGANDFFGGFLVQRGDGSAAMRAGYYTGPDLTYTAIWFNDAGAPGSTNFGFLGNQSITYLNSPSGGNVTISIGGNAASGKSHQFVGGNWTETLGGSVAAYAIVIPSGYIAIESASSIYLDGTNLYLRDSSHNQVVTWGLVYNGATIAQVAAGVTSFTLSQAANAAGSGTNIIVQPQAPFATGAFVGGDFVVNTPASGSTGAKYGGFAVQYNGTTLAGIGTYGNATTQAGFWLGNAPGPTGNYVMYSDGSNLTVNAPFGSGSISFYAAASTQFGTWNSTRLTVATAINHATELDLQIASLNVLSLISGEIIPTAPAWAWVASAVAPTITQAANSSAAGQPLTIRAQDTSFTNANGGALNLYSGAGNGTGTPGAINIGNDKANVGVNIGYNSGVQAGTLTLNGGVVYMSAYGGAGGINFYTNTLGANWNGTLGEFVVVADLNNFTFHKTATTAKLSQQALVAAGTTSNLTIQAQGGWTGATVAGQGAAGDVIVNTPQTIAATGDVKRGGFQVQYNGSPCVTLGTYANNSIGAIWLAQASPSSSNYVLFSNGSAATLSAPAGTLALAVGGSTYASITTALFAVSPIATFATSVQFCSAVQSFGSGTGVLGLANASVVPTTNPSGGGILYSTAGGSWWRDPNGATTQFGAVSDGVAGGTSLLGLVAKSPGYTQRVSGSGLNLKVTGVDVSQANRCWNILAVVTIQSNVTSSQATTEWLQTVIVGGAAPTIVGTNVISAKLGSTPAGAITIVINGTNATVNFSNDGSANCTMQVTFYVYE